MIPNLEGQPVPPLCHEKIKEVSLLHFGSDAYSINQVIYWLLLREEGRLKVESTIEKMSLMGMNYTTSGEDKTVESFYCPHCGTTEMLCGHNGVGCEKESEDANDMLDRISSEWGTERENYGNDINSPPPNGHCYWDLLNNEGWLETDEHLRERLKNKVKETGHAKKL